MSAEPAASHLKPDEIRYLALEGGGGKGFAYLGAIEVLEKCGVMAHLTRAELSAALNSSRFDAVG